MRKMAILLSLSILIYLGYQIHSKYNDIINLTNQDLRNETRLLLDQSSQICVDISKIIDTDTTKDELFDFYKDLLIMQGMLTKAYTDRLINYGMLINIYLTIEDNVRTTIHESYSNDQAIDEFRNDMKLVNIHYLEIHQQLERVYRPFVAGDINSQDISRDTLENLNKIILDHYGELAKSLKK